ncbi:hypothetical protein DM01DRAFT_1398816 [Hesseltinella vesiculosa]|uniref:GPI-anchored cell wall organization protein Ecm33 n=1 Tax=Hesseltinella vesiculosa TaxID=101127 RepID=A0A1X2G497_9FUNG|nr:hypothetical protein DM01DRAFT_1398816 [Hesseltinella vesiculosa]
MARLTIAALALLSLSVATQAAVDCNKSTKGANQADLDALKVCRVYNGTLTVSGSDGANLILDGIEEIGGNLIVMSNPGLVTFSAPQLTKVTGEIKIANQTSLGKLQLPSLVEAKSLTLAVLPVLENLDFPKGLKKVQEMNIQDIRATSITGFKAEAMDSFMLISNNYLSQFDFSTVKSVSGTLEVASNGVSLDFQAKKLASVKRAAFHNLKSVSLPALSKVDGDIIFKNNEFTSLALDSLSSVNGTVQLVSNEKLKEVSFKKLARIGGAFSVGNNTELTTLDGFPMLEAVEGSMDLAGNIDTYFLPVLQDVRGGMRVQTTSSRFECDELERKMKVTNIVKGNVWSCTSAMDPKQISPTVGYEKGGSTNNNLDVPPGSNKYQPGTGGIIEMNQGANLVPTWPMLALGMIALLI